MAQSRISDLTAGTVPMIGTSLLEVSVPNAGAPSGYDSRKFTLTNILSTAVAKAGDTMTGGLLVNGTITQGVTNPNASSQGIASISSAYNEIAVYGAGAGATPFVAISADGTTGWIYSANNIPLRIESDGASGGIYFDTGATPTNRMSIAANGQISLNGTTRIVGSSGGSYCDIFNDSNSHIESDTPLWLNNISGAQVILGGDLNTQNHIIYTGQIFAPNGFLFNANSYFSLDGALTLSWVAGGTQFLVARISDWLFYNNKGPLGGLGPYVNLSDLRSKQPDSIKPTHYGLDTILKLDPVEYVRRSKGEAKPVKEIGFVAQELREVLPEAVRVVGIELPDGSGGIDDDEPSLGVSAETIVAVLCAAVKELSARMKHLEER
jgi:hypothetical protein